MVGLEHPTNNMITNKLNNLLKPDIGLLILRISIGSLMLLHGISKIQNGVEGMKGMLSAKGLPEFMAYGAYIGEVIAPILLIIGAFVRPSAFFIASTMIMAIFLAHSGNIFSLGKSGGSMIELPLLYLFGSAALIFTGAGKFAVRKGDTFLD